MTTTQITKQAEATHAMYQQLRRNAESMCQTVPSCCDKTVAQIAAELDRDETAKSLRRAMRRSR